MGKTIRFVLIGVVAIALLASVPAQAALPASGTLSQAKSALTWTGGPYNVSYPTTELECVDGAADANCDHFMLKVDMGEGAEIKVSTTCSQSGLEPIQGLGGVSPAPNDFDLFVYDPLGHPVGGDGNATCKESVTFTHHAEFRNKAYEVRVIPFLVLPGTTYTGTAKAIKVVK